MFNPLRTHQAEPGKVFFAMPFGTKSLSNGTEFDFDQMYSAILAPSVQSIGMTAQRLDQLYGPTGVLELIWRSIQTAESVVVDFTTRAPNVALEYGWSLLLNKRIVILTQDAEDIPSDVRGRDRWIGYSSNYADMATLTTELREQLVALQGEAIQEMALFPMPGGGAVTIPASVVAVVREYVTVKTDSGQLGLLSKQDVDYSRIINDMSRRYKVGDRVSGAFVVDPLRLEARYTLLVREVNPWPALERKFPVGKVFTSEVVGVSAGLGVFVRVEGKINALLPEKWMGDLVPAIGDLVEVKVDSIISERRRVSVRLNASYQHRSRDTTNREKPPTELVSFPTESMSGKIVRVVPEEDGRGGYVLVKVDCRDRPVMLLARAMAPLTKASLNAGRLLVGDPLTVRVSNHDPRTGKTLVAEVSASESRQ
jgi:small subunit ribosomal protein S1